MSIEAAHNTMVQASAELTQVIMASEAERAMVIATIAAGGHILLEGEPGTGKTELAKGLGKVIGGSYERIQGTPDTEVSDGIGTTLWLPSEERFDFMPGPILRANVLHLDEVNRMNTQVQAAFLEPVGEQHVTVSSPALAERKLPVLDPFITVATQNSHEVSEYTNPLTEAFKDRFMTSLTMRGLTAAEREVLYEKRMSGEKPVVRAVQHLGTAAMSEFIKRIPHSRESIHLAAGLSDRLVELSRDKTSVVDAFPAGFRSTDALMALAKSVAVIRGSKEASVNDVAMVSAYALPHRLTLKHRARNTTTQEEVVADVLRSLQ